MSQSSCASALVFGLGTSVAAAAASKHTHTPNNIVCENARHVVDVIVDGVIKTRKGFLLCVCWRVRPIDARARAHVLRYSQVRMSPTTIVRVNSSGHGIRTCKYVFNRYPKIAAIAHRDRGSSRSTVGLRLVFIINTSTLFEYTLAHAHTRTQWCSGAMEPGTCVRAICVLADHATTAPPYGCISCETMHR